MCKRAMIVMYVVYARGLSVRLFRPSITARTELSPALQTSSMTSDSSSWSGGGAGLRLALMPFRSAIYDAS